MKEFFTKRICFGYFLKTETGLSRHELLLILLIIIAGAGYIFCFTDLIGPAKGTGSPTSHETLVKKPMPPRPKINVAISEEKPAAEQKGVAVTPQHNAGAEKSAPLKPSGEKKSFHPQQAGAKQGPVKSEFPKTDKEHAVQIPPTKSAAAANADATAESAKKPVKTAKKQEETGDDKTSDKSVKGAYTLLVGVYVMEKSMLAEKAKLKSAGLVPVVTKGPKMKEPMNRLFMGEFESYPEAAIELKKIRKITHNAFILPENGKYILYAGSYFVKESAEKERDRLIDVGLKPAVRTTNVPVNTYRLTAGNYQSSKPAEMEAERLKKLGVKVSVVKSGT